MENQKAPIVKYTFTHNPAMTVHPCNLIGQSQASKETARAPIHRKSLCFFKKTYQIESDYNINYNWTHKLFVMFTYVENKDSDYCICD